MNDDDYGVNEDDVVSDRRTNDDDVAALEKKTKAVVTNMIIQFWFTVVVCFIAVWAWFGIKYALLVLVGEAFLGFIACSSSYIKLNKALKAKRKAGI